MKHSGLSSLTPALYLTQMFVFVYVQLIQSILHHTSRVRLYVSRPP